MVNVYFESVLLLDPFYEISDFTKLEFLNELFDFYNDNNLESFELVLV